jgi:hypothetical protein
VAEVGIPRLHAPTRGIEPGAPAPPKARRELLVGGRGPGIDQADDAAAPVEAHRPGGVGPDRGNAPRSLPFGGTGLLSREAREGRLPGLRLGDDGHHLLTPGEGLDPGRRGLHQQTIDDGETPPGANQPLAFHPLEDGAEPLPAPGRHGSQGRAPRPWSRPCSTTRRTACRPRSAARSGDRARGRAVGPGRRSAVCSRKEGDCLPAPAPALRARATIRTRSPRRAFSSVARAGRSSQGDLLGSVICRSTGSHDLAAG